MGDGVVDELIALFVFLNMGKVCEMGNEGKTGWGKKGVAVSKS
jgi:hypothetical protein